MKIIELVSKIIFQLCLDELNGLFKEYLDNQQSITSFISEIEKEIKFVHSDSGNDQITNNNGANIGKSKRLIYL